MTDQIVSLLTVVVAGFVLFMRIKDYRKFKTILGEVTQKDTLVERFRLKPIKETGKSEYLPTTNPTKPISTADINTL